MLRRQFTKKIKNIKMKSGNAYSFRYVAWENDPNPTIIFLNAFSGNHPNTGRQWRFIQGLNLTYISRKYRKRFVKDWQRILGNTKDVKLTYKKVSIKYPYLINSIRRYFYTPSYYITNLQEIPWDQMEKAIVSTWSRDFSKKVKTSLLNKFRRVLGRRKQFKKTGKFPRRK